MLLHVASRATPRCVGHAKRLRGRTGYFSERQWPLHACAVSIYCGQKASARPGQVALGPWLPDIQQAGVYVLLLTMIASSMLKVSGDQGER